MFRRKKEFLEVTYGRSTHYSTHYSQLTIHNSLFNSERQNPYLYIAKRSIASGPKPEEESPGNIERPAS